ncbi:hypothetical protein SAMN05216249_104146 [Acetitomaculum ruminis DSM 5522]|uniref:Serine aminopeptidase S33 domain-containing protein n=1 Tax=Acetitomaculum ruminis DSM 5522 TaxID=1120918 RepID=A0A1I0WMX6_9FIRM|nr:alpha/beta hydrolase [Acetitomaculum ruminis]SFA89520.1 hypothetical protein SAMN05216249_104146 [Acetitomaculum ruminis DSM 5522]
MEKYFDINEKGFSVRCKMFYAKDLKDVEYIVIATHGFGGSKENKTIEKFAQKLYSKHKNYGVLSFDWPCHGADARKKLLLEECMEYLSFVIAYSKEKLNAKDLYIYSVSFGAYLTLKYIVEINNPFKKIALRCPALKMYDTMIKGISKEDMLKLSKKKEVLAGHDRKMKIDQEFLEGLKNSDVMKYDYMDYADDIILIHGTKDEMVNIEDSRKFSQNNVIEMLEVENADHRFSDPKTMDIAIHTIVEFFS